MSTQKARGCFSIPYYLERSVTYSLALEVYPAIAGIALCGVAVSVAARAYVSGDGGFRVPVI
jgi:hypothetical protein